MADNLTKEERSYIMSRIRSKWTKQEMTVHNNLKGRKIRHTMHPKITGNPDLILKEKKVAVFLDGCFWHKCAKHYKLPKSKKDFWASKIERNVKRDKKINNKLRKEGFGVLRFWEHQIEKRLELVIDRIRKSAVQVS